MGRTPRRRREIPPAVMHLLAPVFRESLSRDAYVLRGVGHRFGPVLRPKQTDRNAQLPPAG